MFSLYAPFLAMSNSQLGMSHHRKMPERKNALFAASCFGHLQIKNIAPVPVPKRHTAVAVRSEVIIIAFSLCSDALSAENYFFPIQIGNKHAEATAQRYGCNENISGDYLRTIPTR